MRVFTLFVLALVALSVFGVSFGLAQDDSDGGEGGDSSLGVDEDIAVAETVDPAEDSEVAAEDVVSDAASIDDVSDVIIDLEKEVRDTDRQITARRVTVAWGHGIDSENRGVAVHGVWAVAALADSQSDARVVRRGKVSIGGQTYRLVRDGADTIDSVVSFRLTQRDSEVGELVLERDADVTNIGVWTGTATLFATTAQVAETYDVTLATKTRAARTPVKRTATIGGEGTRRDAVAGRNAAGVAVDEAETGAVDDNSEATTAGQDTRRRPGFWARLFGRG